MPVFVYIDHSQNKPDHNPMEFFYLSTTRESNRRSLAVIDDPLETIMEGRSSCYYKRAEFLDQLEALHKRHVNGAYATQKALDQLPSK